MPELRILSASHTDDLALQHPWSVENLPNEGELVYGVTVKVSHGHGIYADELRLLRMHPAARYTTPDLIYWGCNDLGPACFGPRGELLVPEVEVYDGQNIPSLFILRRSPAVDHLAWLTAYERDLAERRRAGNAALEASLTRIFKPVVEAVKR